MSWTQAWPALALLLAVVLLPGLVRLAKTRGWIRGVPPHQVATVVSVSPISPNQRVVTLEVKHGEHHRMLLLGVTAQSVCVLDSWTPPSQPPERLSGASVEP
ncbi:flagellar biosynthetic protein FliO [Hydrogenophaga soli]